MLVYQRVYVIRTLHISAYVMIDHDISGTMWWFAGNIRELRSPMSPMFMHHGEMGSETERLSSKPTGLVNGWLNMARPTRGPSPSESSACRS